MQIGADDPKIIVRNMRERRTAFDIPEREDSLRSGLQPIVHLDNAVLTGLNACGGEIQRIRIRHPPSRNQQVGANQFGCTAL